MIVPSGNRRDQVAQGGLRNRTIFESDIFKDISEKFAQNAVRMREEAEKPQQPQQIRDDPRQPQPSEKDLKMQELQQTMNESNTLPQEQEESAPDLGVGGEFIDISKQISKKVIDALGLNKRPNEMWQGKTEIANDGDEVTGITIKLTKAMPKDMAMMGKVAPSPAPPYGGPMKQQKQPGDMSPGGPVTNSV